MSYFSKNKFNFFSLFIGVFSLLFVSFSCQTKSKKTEPKESISTNPQQAILDAKIKNNPTNADAWYERAVFFLDKKNVGKAAEDINQALDLDTTKAAYFLVAADIHLLTNNSGKCKIALEKCLQIEPTNLDALSKMSELYLFVGQNKTSLDYAGKVLEIDKNQKKVLFLIGMNQKEIGDTGKAIYAFQRAIEIDQNYFDAYIQLGILYGQKKNPLCLEYYRTASTINPKSAEPYYNSGVYFQQKGKTKEAINNYTKATELNPKFKNTWYNLGVIYLTTINDYKVALSYFNKVIELDPNFEQAYYMKGLTYERMNNLSSAESFYTQAMQIKPDYEDAFEALKRLKRSL
jgi:tetratricopeptide (TPR) repeat protein